MPLRVRLPLPRSLQVGSGSSSESGHLRVGSGLRVRSIASSRLWGFWHFVCDHCGACQSSGPLLDPPAGPGTGEGGRGRGRPGVRVSTTVVPQAEVWREKGA